MRWSRPSSRGSWAGWPSPTPSSPISATRRSTASRAGPRWPPAGARTQRLLWASTSTKNPNYRDVIYVEELIGPDTVDTIPPATYDAFRDHGTASASLEDDLEDAQHTMDSLADSGIAMKAVTDQLLADRHRSLSADAFDLPA